MAELRFRELVNHTVHDGSAVEECNISASFQSITMVFAHAVM